MILGAVGTGKTSACMYPVRGPVAALAGGRRRPEAGRPGAGGEGRLLPAGAHHAASARVAPTTTSRSGSTRASATTRCTTTSTRTPWPTPIATLLNNLFGKSKEPFWQQAYTDLLKFVILLRRITDGYTTFAEVYRYILDDTQIDRDIRRLKASLDDPPEVVVFADGGIPAAQRRSAPGATGSRKTPATWRIRTTPTLETYLADAGRSVRRPEDAGHRVGRAEAPTRGPRALVLRAAGVGSIRGCARPSPRASSCSSRCSTTTRPCTARSVRRASAYLGTPAPGEPRPLAAARRTCSTPGTVLALNFPVAHEPRSGTHHRRDAEAGLPARGAAAHPEDGGRAASGSGATCCSSATSTTPLPRSVRRTRPATSGRSRSRGRRA